MDHPAKSELDQLTQLQTRADKIGEDAARWPALLNQARANLAAAQKTFVAALDAKAAAAVTEADAHVRALLPACSALDAAGGPLGLRRRVLDSAEALEIFAAGFQKRIDALEKLKPAARALYSRFTAKAVAAGADPRLLVGLNTTADMRGAQALLDQLDEDARTARVAIGYATSSGGHVPRSFESLLEFLSAPLPVVPAV
jgi:hypothetical protein